jgi:hypothetical protein
MFLFGIRPAGVPRSGSNKISEFLGPAQLGPFPGHFTLWEETRNRKSHENPTLNGRMNWQNHGKSMENP